MRNPNLAVKSLFVAASLLLAGCDRGPAERLFGKDSSSSSSQTVAQSSPVACCRDNDGFGNMSYPVFVPVDHAEFCDNVRIAARRDRAINGVHYLAVGVGCGQGNGFIGDEYYPSTGY